MELQFVRRINLRVIRVIAILAVAFLDIPISNTIQRFHNSNIEINKFYKYLLHIFYYT